MCPHLNVKCDTRSFTEPSIRQSDDSTVAVDNNKSCTRTGLPLQSEQECIPVGCVPPACCPYLPHALFPGGIPGPGGCTWSQGGVPGPGGGCLVPGGVPGPREGVPGRGWVPGPGGGVPDPRGCTWSPGVYLPRYSPPPWTEFLTHASENITLPQTSFAGGKNILIALVLADGNRSL